MGRYKIIWDRLVRGDELDIYEQGMMNGCIFD